MSHAGLILCGGRSSRMGRPKALLPWRGRPLVAHMVSVLRQAVSEVLVVSAPDLPLPPLDAPVVVDREPGLGPLAGIREGLHRLGGARVFVTATDAPFLTPAFVKTLLDCGGAAAPVVDGHVQTLAAVYPADRAAAADALLAEGRRRPLFLLEAGDGYHPLPREALPDPEALESLDTPESYLAALRRDGATGSARVELYGMPRKRLGRSHADVPFGTLAQVLEAAGDGLATGNQPAAGVAVSLDGGRFLRELSVPVGPGESVVVMGAQAGG